MQRGVSVCVEVCVMCVYVCVEVGDGSVLPACASGKVCVVGQED